jgi:hypothetical protein
VKEVRTGSSTSPESRRVSLHFEGCQCHESAGARGRNRVFTRSSHSVGARAGAPSAGPVTLPLPTKRYKVAAGSAACLSMATECGAPVHAGLDGAPRLL